MNCPETIKGPFKSAWWKGYYAHAGGESIVDNPYPDHRTKHKNSVTFSRAFRNYWLEGWMARKLEATK
jgi:hypothetical protein